MSLLNQASLIQIPSGYKEGTLYSAKPINGDGDLDFTRSNDTATRVNSDGLIEKVRTNMLAYSEQFDNAYWTKSGSSVVSGFVSPKGDLSAFKLVEGTSTTQFIRASITVTVGNNTISIFAKADERDWILLWDGFSSKGRYFDIKNGNIGGFRGSAPENSSIDNIGNGWYRCSMTVNSGSTNLQNQIYLADADGSFNYNGNGTSGVYLWGAQAELSDFGATDYIPTTTTAVSVGMTANVPRVDYSGGGCPKLLLEPQRTNLVTFSEQFNNADWGKSNAIITANNTASPDGYTNADKITDNANNNQHRVTQNISVTSGTSYTASIFVKNDDKGDFTINFTSTGFPSTKIVFNLINGTITSGTGTIEDYGNGWYRISATAAANITGSGTIGFNLGDGGAYVGTGESVFIWGAQIEVGSYATSYINTLSAASTRGQDACSKTGISSLIGQTSGTIYVDLDLQVASEFEHLFNVFDSTNTENILVYLRNTNRIRFAAVGTTNYDDEVISSGKHKVAVVYDGSNISYFRDGIKLVTRTNFAKTLTFSDFYLGNRTNADENPAAANQVLIFPTALTDSEIAIMTGNQNYTINQAYASYGVASESPNCVQP